ncbi:MAG TPA: TfuA-related McrA-glycine thioamidation protein, partial [Candidatus Methanoperedens sp.]
EDAGILNKEEASALVEITRKIFYPDRNYMNILIECVKKGIIQDSRKEKLLGFLRKHEIDVKREDAVLVLEKIADLGRK